MENGRQRFDVFAENYESVLNKSIGRYGGNSLYYAEKRIGEIRRYYRHAGQVKPSKVMEFGCGTGKHLELLRSLFPSAELFGVDVSPRVLEVARNRSISNCSVFHYDGLCLPSDVKNVDLVVVINVFHHIPRDLHLQTLELLYSTMKKGAILCLFEHNPANPLTRKIVRDCPMDVGVELLSSGYTRTTLTKGKWKDIETRFILFFPPLLSMGSSLERFMFWIPLGAQYAVFAVKQ